MAKKMKHFYQTHSYLRPSRASLVDAIQSTLPLFLLLIFRLAREKSFHPKHNLLFLFLVKRPKMAPGIILRSIISYPSSYCNCTILIEWEKSFLAVQHYIRNTSHAFVGTCKAYDEKASWYYQKKLQREKAKLSESEIRNPIPLASLGKVKCDTLMCWCQRGKSVKLRHRYTIDVQSKPILIGSAMENITQICFIIGSDFCLPTSESRLFSSFVDHITYFLIFHWLYVRIVCVFHWIS